MLCTQAESNPLPCDQDSHWNTSSVGAAPSTCDATRVISTSRRSGPCRSLRIIVSSPRPIRWSCEGTPASWIRSSSRAIESSAEEACRVHKDPRCPVARLFILSWASAPRTSPTMMRLGASPSAVRTSFRMSTLDPGTVRRRRTFSPATWISRAPSSRITRRSG